MTTNTVKHTPADAAPIELAGMFLEWQRIEDAKAELAEQSKDLFKAAKDKGYDTKAMRAVFREKRVELEASPEDAAKAEEAEAMNDLYRSALDRGLTARARPAHDAREIIEEFDAETGEIRDEPEAAAEVAGDYLREPVAAEQGQIIREGDAPRETDRLGGDASRPDAESHSQAIPSKPADTAEGVNPSSRASSATHSDDIDLTIPDFLRRTEGGYPKREAVEA